MPRKVTAKDVLTACQMSFQGETNKNIAKILGYTATTVSHWRNTELWKEFEEELIDAYKKQMLSQQFQVDATPSQS